MRKFRSLFALLFVVIWLTGLLSGCSGVIREDAVQQSLPAIDPDAGLERETTHTLYYRLMGGSTLLPVQTTLRVRSTEYEELAAIRQLLKEPANANVQAVMPTGTRLMNLSMENGILYVTFNRAFLSGDIGEGLSREQTQQARRLAVYAVVNTLTGMGNVDRVQILIDLDDKGKGSRVPAYMLGFSEAEGGPNLLEPLGFYEGVLTTPITTAGDALTLLQGEDYARAFSLFASDEGEDRQRPDYSLFEAALMGLCRVEAWQIHTSKTNSDGTCAVTLDLTFSDPQGQTYSVEDAQLMLYYESGLYRVGYFSLIDIILTGTGEGSA